MRYPDSVKTSVVKSVVVAGELIFVILTALFVLTRI